MVKKIDKMDGLDMCMIDWIKLKFFMDTDKSASRYPQHFTIFKDGWPE
jgi:hypothetical protein